MAIAGARISRRCQLDRASRQIREVRTIYDTSHGPVAFAGTFESGMSGWKRSMLGLDGERKRNLPA